MSGSGVLDNRADFAKVVALGVGVGIVAISLATAMPVIGAAVLQSLNVQPFFSLADAALNGLNLAMIGFTLSAVLGGVTALGISQIQQDIAPEQANLRSDVKPISGAIFTLSMIGSTFIDPRGNGKAFSVEFAKPIWTGIAISAVMTAMAMLGRHMYSAIQRVYVEAQNHGLNQNEQRNGCCSSVFACLRRAPQTIPAGAYEAVQTA